MTQTKDDCNNGRKIYSNPRNSCDVAAKKRVPPTISSHPPQSHHTTTPQQSGAVNDRRTQANVVYCIMETPLAVMIICKVPNLIESARNLVRNAPGKMQSELQRRSVSTRLQQASQLVTPTRTTSMNEKGPVLRFAFLAANLLLNAGKVAPGQSFMWILPTPQARTGGRSTGTRCVEPVTLKVSKAAVARKNDDSMWWLTRHLLPTVSWERKQRCEAGSLSQQSRKKHSNSKHANGEPWALTRALVPHKYQHPSSGEKVPVPGKPPPGSK